jgi:hypothetical protein
MISPAQDIEGLVSALQIILKSTQGSVREACPKAVPNSDLGQRNVLLKICGLERLAHLLKRFKSFCDKTGERISELKEELLIAIIEVSTRVRILTNDCSQRWLAT